MLDPDSRSLYSSILAPPSGMVFDEAIAATFSMDPVLLLEAPLHLALMTDARMSEPGPLSVLQSVRRYSERITAYVQKGRIRVPRAAKPNPLFGLLEEMIVELQVRPTSPSGGVFHPKLWAIRFSSLNGQDSMIRLVILTRNMTNNPSWDLSVRLEGRVGPHKEKVNEPLSHFFGMLPKLALKSVNPDREKQALRFSEEIQNVSWVCPDGFDKLEFYIPGTEGFDWDPPESNRMAVISPFCSDEALQTLAEKTASAEALISTPEQMADLKKDTLDLFSRCWHLDEAAETEGGEDNEEKEGVYSVGLHAKAYLFETDRGRTHLVTGSANATNAVLLHSKNIEILVRLEGETDKIGGIEELIHKDGLGKYLVPFDTDGKGNTNIDPQMRKAEECIDDARLKLAEAQLSLKCSRASGDDLWTLTLVGNIPFLDGIRTATAWPITVMEDSGTSILGNNSGKIDLGKFSTSSVTGLVAFELRSRHHSHFSVSFVMNLPVEGMPADERNSAILKTVIKNQDGFMKYLLLLLGDAATNDSVTPGFETESHKWISRLSRGEEFPLLEEMVRAYSRYPDRLSEISSLIRDLLSRGDANQFVPEKFIELWKVFESALGERDARQ